MGVVAGHPVRCRPSGRDRNLAVIPGTSPRGLLASHHRRFMDVRPGALRIGNRKWCPAPGFTEVDRPPCLCRTPSPGTQLRRPIVARRGSSIGSWPRWNRSFTSFTFGNAPPCFASRRTPSGISSSSTRPRPPIATPHPHNVMAFCASATTLPMRAAAEVQRVDTALTSTCSGRVTSNVRWLTGRAYAPSDVCGCAGAPATDDDAGSDAGMLPVADAGVPGNPQCTAPRRASSEAWSLGPERPSSAIQHAFCRHLGRFAPRIRVLI